MQIEAVEKIITYYVDKDENVTVTCPGCNLEKTFNVSALKSTGKHITGKCKCGEVFKFIVEYRRLYRKKVHLKGEYTVVKTGKRNQIAIEDISMGGVGFRTLDPTGLAYDELIEIRFRLDDPGRSEITKRARVRNSKDNFVGVEFETMNFYDKKLGFYLMP